MANRLTSSTSPYLQQHAENPVDWYEWGDEAFAEARRRDVPLLISVGYAACHWCHVMAHESFEDQAVARYMNEHFVNVKVDREERPDVDAVYMEATQAMTGHGGWPMTVFATPAGRPFYCGTYFPPRPVHGMPSFPQLLQALADAWVNRRGEIDESAASIRDALAGHAPHPALPHGQGVDDTLLDRALDELVRGYDAERGGFGGAPKFPPSMLLEWLLRHDARVGSERALRMASRTLEAMARGGMYDQLGGGFARYSVDADWVVPHFEKMLYDNALLLRVYTHWWRATASPLALRVVTETADWLLRELRTPEGGFASALDADSLGPDGHSHEGAFYAWTPDQLREVLGDDDGAWAAEVFTVTGSGTFEHGQSVVQLRADPWESDGEVDEGSVAERYRSVRARLFEARESRPRPARDDKVVAAWNGLAIAALSEAGALLDRADWLEAAVAAAELLASVHLTRSSGLGPDTGSGADTASVPRTASDPNRSSGRLRLARTSREGRVGTAPGVLEDYGDTAEGLLALSQATADPRWAALAGELLDEVLTRFGDGAGGFYDTAEDETDAVLAGIRRPRDPADGPAPAGQAAAAGALLTYAALTGSSTHREAAERALTEPLLLATRYPRAAGWGLAVTEALLDGPREVAVVGPHDDPRTHDLRRIALRSAAPGLVLAVGGRGWPSDLSAPAAPSTTDAASAPSAPSARPAPPARPAPVGPTELTPDVTALLTDRPLVDDRPTAYVCRGFVCDRPTTDPAELVAQLTR